MRLMITGLDAEGRSRIEHERWIGNDLGDRVDVTQIVEFTDWPPQLLAADGGEEYGVSPAPGTLQWKLAYFPPGHRFPPHHTASVDLDAVLSGEVILGLGDGDHRLVAGDCVVVRGVSHSWVSGPDGVLMAITRIGVAR